MLHGWLGIPSRSFELMSILYVSGFASFGTLITAVIVVAAALATLIGLEGVSVQIAAGRDLASHLTAISPRYPYEGVIVKLAQALLPGNARRLCGPEIV